jgi:hypothetical protein
MNPFRKLVEMFLPQEVSPVKGLPAGHPSKQYSYTLIGFNEKPLGPASLLKLGFVGQIKGSSDYIVEGNEVLWKDLNVVVQIATIYHIHKIRKYHDTGHGIQWEDTARNVYVKLTEAQLFPS